MGVWEVLKSFVNSKVPRDIISTGKKMARVGKIQRSKRKDKTL